VNDGPLFLRDGFEENNMSWAYWEFSAGFGIYNPGTKSLNTTLVDALLHNEMPEPVPIKATLLYTSNFSGGADGWSFVSQAGSSGSMLASGGKLNITITNGGTEAWHIQLVKNNIALKKDKTYRISFKALATANRSLSFYAGKASDPWNAYSGSSANNIVTQEVTYSKSFTMTYATDMAARLVFDLGTSATGVTITQVKVEEIELAPVITTDAEDMQGESTVKYYPNPVRSLLQIEGVEKYKSAVLYDLYGRKLNQFILSSDVTMLNLENIPSGFYLIWLTGSNGNKVLKIVKE
jgi:endoglucanase